MQQKKIICPATGEAVTVYRAVLRGISGIGSASSRDQVEHGCQAETACLHAGSDRCPVARANLGA